MFTHKKTSHYVKFKTHTSMWNFSLKNLVNKQISYRFFFAFRQIVVVENGLLKELHS